VLNHLLQREKRIRDKKEEIYILFANMKAAFDNMDREILWKDLREKGINEQLLRRIEKIRRNGGRDKDEGRIHGRIQDKKRSEAGLCYGSNPLQCILYVYIADLDKRMREKDIRGVGISKNRI